MTDDKIEAAAREAAIDHGEWLEADADETNCDSFVAGFKAGHASRDAEIADLRAKLAAMQRERECRKKLVEALKQVEKDRAYQKLSGGLHFSSASTEMEWKAESAAKTRKMVRAALEAAKELE